MKQIDNDLTLHGPPMLVDKTNFDLVLYNHANFYRFEETSSYWSAKQISVFLCFSLVNQRHTSGITVYNRTCHISGEDHIMLSITVSNPFVFLQ